MVFASPGPPNRSYHNTLARTESLNSQRSDRKVSFRKDVGVKHIPRGQKIQDHQAIKNGTEEGWENGPEVRRYQENLTEEEAESLVNLLDQLDCRTGSAPLVHPAYSTQSLDRQTKRNNIINNKLDINKEKTPLKLNSNIAANLINKRSPKTEFGSTPIFQRNRKTSDLTSQNKLYTSTELISSSDSEKKRELSGHQSVPDLSRTSYHENARRQLFSDSKTTENPTREYRSVDNLVNKNNYIEHRTPINEGKSFDNLSSYKPHPQKSNLFGHKSVGHLPSVTEMNAEQMEYSPKVENIIRKLNAGAEESKIKVYYAKKGANDSLPRGVVEPSKKRFHNNNQPFSYTGTTPLTSCQVVRQLSPSRDLAPNGDVYAQVNKQNKAIQREKKVPEHDYSAKIIITDSSPSSKYYNKELYDPYQNINEKIMNKFLGIDSSDEQQFVHAYKNLENNNINMYSVGVQTDGLPKAPSRGRKTTKATLVDSPEHSSYAQNNFKSDLTSASLVRQVNHGFGRFDRSPSPPPRLMAAHSAPKSVIPLLSDASDSEVDFRRRSDPLAKIRDQVMLRERQREGQWGEHRNAADFHHYLMEEEANRYAENERLRSMQEVDARREYSPERPPREKNNERSPSRGGILERTQKNNLSAIEKKEKGKKKKRIKIKFFYDPRHEDDPEDDPLKRFTEYKGNYEHQSLPMGDNNAERQASRERSVDAPFRNEKEEQRHQLCDRRVQSEDRRYGTLERDVRDNRMRAAQRSQSYHVASDKREYQDKRGVSYGRRGEDDEAYEDCDLKDSTVRGDRFLSEKFQNGSQTYKGGLTIEDEQELERLKRQRNKFLTSFINEGRAKASSTPVKRDMRTTNSMPRPTKTRGASPIPKSVERLKNENSSRKNTPPKKKKKRAWPWAFLGLRGGVRGSAGPSSRPSSRASSLGSAHQHRRTKKTNHPRRDSLEDERAWQRNPAADSRELRRFGNTSSTLTRVEPRYKQASGGLSEERRVSQPPSAIRKSSGDSSASSNLRVQRTTSFKQRYFGDSDVETRTARHNSMAGEDYRSLPNRASRSAAYRNTEKRMVNGPRGRSPLVGGSAGSSLQSSESEMDSHHGSNASKVSHVSTKSNRSVYMHETIVADIPSIKNGDEVTPERPVSRQTRKVSRSFSLLAPWRPRQYREKYEIEYDNRDIKDGRAVGVGSSALPPRPPRRHQDLGDERRVSRSQSTYKDSKLPGWFKRKRAKEPAKGIA